MYFHESLFFLGGEGGGSLFLLHTTCVLGFCILSFFNEVNNLSKKKKCVGSRLLVKVENLDLLGEVTSV